MLARSQAPNASSLTVCVTKTASASRLRYHGGVRAYIRHPTGFPIELRSVERDGEEPEGSGRLHDVSVGGLCCLSRAPFSEGTTVTIRIPVGEKGFEAQGRVAWCKAEADRYRVGIAFSDEALAFSARMVEQVCHIASYRDTLREQGLELSEEDAAREWIGKYAKNFPR